MWVKGGQHGFWEKIELRGMQMVFHALWRDLDSRLSLGYVTQQCIVPIPHLWVSVTKWAKCFSQTLPTRLPIAWLERQVFQRSQEINRNGCLDKFI